MLTLVLEMTTRCNLRCKHCLRDWTRPAQDLDPDLIKELLGQAKKLGFERVSLTGGEPTLHPAFPDIIRMIVDFGFRFGWMCNGSFFRDYVPLFLNRDVRKFHEAVCFSLDGPDAETHDRVRGEGSFNKVLSAAQLCRLKEIPFSLKTILHKLNLDKGWDTVRLAGSLGANGLGVAVASPAPRLVASGLMPSVEQFRTIPEIIRSFRVATRGFVHVEGNVFARNRGQQLYCFAMRGEGYNVTPDGKLSFCCNLSGADQNGVGDSSKDIVADLTREPLSRAVAKHAHMVADYVEHLMTKQENRHMGEMDYFKCLECYQYFSKMDWLQDFSGDWSSQTLESRGHPESCENSIRGR